MTGIEVFLLILGFTCVCISFFMGRTNNSIKDSEKTDSYSKELWSEQDTQIVKDEVQRILEEEKEAIIMNTSDSLNRKSNEKIIEFEEYSAQVFEKINKNHDDVVFMYNLLNEKEAKLKEELSKPIPKPKKVETTKKVVQKPKTVAASKAPKVERPIVEKQQTIHSYMTDEILRMYKGGKSVLEISKDLDIGQGEVKLMIALYGGKR